MTKTQSDPLIKRILVPTDGSEGALEAAAYAAELARHFHAGVGLLHVVSPMRVMPHVSGLREEELRQNLMEAGKTILTLTQAPFARAGVPVDEELREGSPADVIVEVAVQGGHDLVVVGSRGSGMADSWLLGSVAQRVVRNAPCPVLVVRRRSYRTAGVAGAPTERGQ